jgi:hypothetical protein
MIYDLTNPLHRKQFVKRANAMLKKNCTNAVLVDESKRTPNQNSYLHVLIRIMALSTGVKESYAKEVYFKRLANPDLFIRTQTDPITGEETNYTISSSTLDMEEMSRAINNFRRWAEEEGYYLPDATFDEDERAVFKTEQDEQAFHQAEVETERASMYID